ncbi:MAG: band-7 C-terminal domain-containing protein, partial [Acidithiobacillus sp.]|nr:band-7 C-terminal domain-containing protein [Acidithiobacillus sp.]
TAEAIRVIGSAAREPGGYEALQMQLAKDYIEKWGYLAKSSTSLVIPSDLGNIGALVGTALSMVKQSQKTAAE